MGALKLGISDRMINQEMSVEDILRFADINWQSVDEILKIKREESEDYLMKALEY